MDNSSADTSSKFDIDTIITDGMTTEQQSIAYAKQIEYNTRMSMLGLNNLYVLALVVLSFVVIYMMLKRWYFNYM